MSNLPEAVPCPDKPPLHLRGGYLCVAAPLDFTEACFSAPAVRALRKSRPNSTMAIVCPESQAALWEVMPELNEVIVYPDRASASQIAEIIRGQKITFESSIAWESSSAAKAFAKSKIYQRLGYPATGLVKYLTDEVDVVNEPGSIQHRVRHYLDLVKRLGGDAYVPASFRTASLPAPPEVIRIVIAPGSNYGAAYEWPVKNFQEVVQRMNDRFDKIEWVILPDIISSSKSKKGGACEKLRDLLGDSSVTYLEEIGVSEIIKSLQSCSALLASDSMVAHLAAHLGLPATVIFGPNEPEWKRPLGKQNQVLREHVACSPCYLTKCPIDHRCQNEVTVEMVVGKLEESLKLRV